MELQWDHRILAPVGLAVFTPATNNNLPSYFADVLVVLSKATDYLSGFESGRETF
jgi:hypothetical protein